MESIWTGTAEDSFFNADSFDKHRTLVTAEKKSTILPSMKNVYYIMSVDIGRLSDRTVIEIFKVFPNIEGASTKNLVNIFILSDTHFEAQTIMIKEIAEKFQVKKIVLDANGMGVGVLDYLVKPNVNPESGIDLPPFGVDYQNEDQELHYKKYETSTMKKNMIYIIKATSDLNSEMHVNALSQLASGKVKLLIDHQAAKMKLLSTKKGQNMSPEERAEALAPYTATSILKEEMTNLRAKRDMNNKVSLERVNKRITKDTFSAFEMGLYYIKMQDEQRKQERVGLENFIFGTRSAGVHRSPRTHRVCTRRGKR